MRGERMRRALVLAAAVLAVLLLAGGLAPSSVSYDGLAFVLRGRAGGLDYGHALHVPLLALAGEVAGARAAPERAGQLAGAAGAALAFALLWRRLARGGTPFTRAGLVSGLFAASTLMWQQAGALEPTPWTSAALLAAGEAAAAYGRRPGWGRLAALLLAFLVALGFHVVSLLALPWLAALARGSGARLPRMHLAGVAAAAALVLALALAGGELAAFLAYWSGFLPRFEAGVARELGMHLARGGRLVLEGAPGVAAHALGGAVASRLGAKAELPVRQAPAAQAAAWLAGPYALAVLLLGKPLVGLLAPVVLAAALHVGEVLAEPLRPLAARPAWRRRATSVLALALAVQLALSVPQALAWHAAPDVPRVRAGLIARHLPEGTRLLAGPYANHLRLHHPEVELVDVLELVHHGRVRDRHADPAALVLDYAARSDRPCVLSSDAAAWLIESLGVDPERLGLRPGAAFLIPEDPRLALFPL
jgi:hypothetical protein